MLRQTTIGVQPDNDIERFMKGKRTLPIEQWVSYRFGLIGSKVGVVLSPMYAAKYDLPLVAWRSLAVIERYGPVSAGELGAKTSSDPFKMARAIELLVKRGLITRTPDPSDRRRASLELTVQGRDVHADIAGTAVAIEKFLVETLTAEEATCLQGILQKVDAKVDELSAAGWESFAPIPRAQKQTPPVAKPASRRPSASQRADR